VIVAPRGRARQMNAGAAVAADADVLLFLHADTRLPQPTPIRLVLAALAAARAGAASTCASMAGRACCRGGGADEPALALERHRHRRPGDLRAARPSRQLGGFPDQPLMEDIELSRRLQAPAGAAVPAPARRHLGPPLGPARRLAHHRADVAAALALLARRQPRAPGAGLPVSTLIVFAKAPVAGLAKTRLIPALGAEGAAASGRAPAAPRGAARPGRRPGQGRPVRDARLPSRRVRRACRARRCTCQIRVRATWGSACPLLSHACWPHDRTALLIGTDAPAIDAGCLQRAAAALQDHDAVFVPAVDGGYALVGLKHPSAALFLGMTWSHDRVMADTRARLRGRCALGRTGAGGRHRRAG
jgi:hypothetical protein